MNSRISRLFITLSSVMLAAVVSLPDNAETTLPAIFTDHMVLQRGESTPVWGWAPPQQQVKVTFGQQTVTTTTTSEGRWYVELKGLEASSTGMRLTVRSDETVEFTDVVVGDVWLASGQSNMAMTVAKSDGKVDAIRTSSDPNLRMIVVRPTGVSPMKPLDEFKGEWQVAGPQTVGNVTAVGYSFARRLREGVGDLPIGLIQSSWGGTLAEQWTSRQALESHATTKPLWTTFQQRVETFDPASATPADVAKKLTDEWQKANREARRNKTRIPPRPKIISSPIKKRYTPSNQFNTMIHPVIPYGIRGFVWYQGEGNRERAEQYQTLLPVMIADWRTRWGRPQAPFYIVQLANIGKAGLKPADDEPTDSEWAEQQWAQFVVARNTSNSGLAVINDGSDTSLHPREKKKVGDRLALLALAHDYGKQNVEFSGPVYREFRLEGESVRVFFDLAEGLRSRDGKPLQRFQIAGADKKWVWAEASIDGNEVLVTSPKVQKPVAVRYAWQGNPAGANLTNRSGLPASLFKTDEWPGLSAGKVLPATK